jgi:hypothetical protein
MLLAIIGSISGNRLRRSDRGVLRRSLKPLRSSRRPNSSPSPTPPSARARSLPRSAVC